jgi:hypothetical protein
LGPFTRRPLLVGRDLSLAALFVARGVGLALGVVALDSLLFLAALALGSGLARFGGLRGGEPLLLDLQVPLAGYEVGLVPLLHRLRLAALRFLRGICLLLVELTLALQVLVVQDRAGNLLGLALEAVNHAAVASSVLTRHSVLLKIVRGTTPSARRRVDCSRGLPSDRRPQNAHAPARDETPDRVKKSGGAIGVALSPGQTGGDTT